MNNGLAKLRKTYLARILMFIFRDSARPPIHFHSIERVLTHIRVKVRKNVQLRVKTKGNERRPCKTA